MVPLMLGFLTAGAVAETSNQTPTRAAYEMLLKEFPGGPSEYINRNEDRGRAVAARFFAFARDHRDAPDAVEALGWVASHLKGLTGLDMLGLRNTKVTDTELAHLKQLTSLTRLDLGETQITAAGLAHLAGLTQMRRLVLRGTAMTDVGVAQLKGLTSLQELDLGQTQVTDAGVAALQKALPQMLIAR